MNVKPFFVSNFFIKNQCYLIHKDGCGVLVDPAWNYKLINEYLSENNITLKGVLLTHSHEDHVNLAEEFAKEHAVPVFMSGLEIDYYSFNCKALNRAEHLKVITIDQLKIKPIITPGHTSGGTCYLIDNHLFSGDTVFIEGVGKCTGEGGNVHEMYHSVQFLKNNLPKNTLFWPGHSYGQTPGKDLIYLLENNIYFQFDNEKDFIDFRMRKK